MQNLKMFIIFTCVSVGSLIHGVNPEKIVQTYRCLGHTMVETLLRKKTDFGRLIEDKPVGLSLELKADKSEIGRLDVIDFAWREEGGSSACIDNLAVRAMDQRKGVGSMLLGSALRRLETLQAQCVVTSYDDVDEDNLWGVRKDDDSAVEYDLVTRQLSDVTLRAQPDNPADLEKLCNFYKKFGFESEGKQGPNFRCMKKTFERQ